MTETSYSIVNTAVSPHDDINRFASSRHSDEVEAPSMAIMRSPVLSDPSLNEQIEQTY